ncbi:hypothetical protein JI735_33705 (plasmid) [Paenibacillus sonchi]|uniref:Phage ABA sandwich domain-containing protein n=1 Tax=Paenibacillus sonchi TaxID=373687 RepID=A0A974PJG4_9BACL|nr:hypothetical protein [Paenibacillus sonchi]QQZ64608.1 hypothetical protein JI735_33705 [Paenibacillus sonchi]
MNKAYEKERAYILTHLTKMDIRKSRMLCEPQIQRFNDLQPDERDQVIYSEVMAYGPFATEVPPFEGEVTSREEFHPTQRLDHAFQVFNYILVPDKLSLVPCGSSVGPFWIVYFEDVYLGVGKTIEMAICISAIVINDAITYKMNM